jgi:hypothetical protein
MYANTLLKKTRSNLVWLVLPLSVIGLSLELLPEIEAKMIVVSILILMIVLCMLELREGWSIKQRWFKTFWVISIILVGISLTAEILPEVHAKIIVIPALSLTLINCLVEISIGKRNRRF